MRRNPNGGTPGALRSSFRTLVFSFHFFGLNGSKPFIGNTTPSTCPATTNIPVNEPASGLSQLNDAGISSARTFERLRLELSLLHLSAVPWSRGQADRLVLPAAQRWQRSPKGNCLVLGRTHFRRKGGRAPSPTAALEWRISVPSSQYLVVGLIVAIYRGRLMLQRWSRLKAIHA